MSDFSVRSDNVDVEQIMRQIRSRIREKRGVDYTEDEIRELANVKLEKFIDPKGVRSDLLQQYRQAREASLPPNYKFEDTTLFETHRGALAFIRRLLRPILKLFFNPNPLIDALHIQSKLNDAHAAIEPLHYEIIHNLVLELTRTSIEVKSLKMRLESMASRLDFDERRARALEGVVQYRPGAVAPLQPPTGQDQRREGRDRRDQGPRDQGRRDQGQRDRGPRDERPRDERPREERPRDERSRDERSRDERPREERPREERSRDRGPQPPREIAAQPQTHTQPQPQTQTPRPEGQEANALDNDGNERRSRRRRRRGRRRGSGAREGSAGFAEGGAPGDTRTANGEPRGAETAEAEPAAETGHSNSREEWGLDEEDVVAETEPSVSVESEPPPAPVAERTGTRSEWEIDDWPPATTEPAPSEPASTASDAASHVPHADTASPEDSGAAATSAPAPAPQEPVAPEPQPVEAHRGEDDVVPPKPVEVERGEGG
jgi:hypothetical protein